MGELIGADTRSVNPFLVPNILDGDRDAMASRRGLWCSDRELRNDGDKPLPPMRLEPHCQPTGLLNLPTSTSPS